MYIDENFSYQFLNKNYILTFGIKINTILHYIQYENYILSLYLFIEFNGGRGAAARGVTVKPTGCGFDLHSRR